MPSWSNINPVDSNRAQLDDLMELIELPEDEWRTLRLIGNVWSFAETSPWFTIDKISPKTGKPIAFPKLCLDYNPETEEYDLDVCPYRAAGRRFRKIYLANAIDRDEQERPPRNPVRHTKQEQVIQKIAGSKCFVKDMESKSYTPVGVLRMPPSLARKIKNLISLNTHTVDGEKVAFDLSDPEYGCDISVMRVKGGTGTGMYDVQIASKRTPLTKEEKRYLRYDITAYGPETEEEAKQSWAWLKKHLVDEDEDEDGDKREKGKGRARGDDYEDSDGRDRRRGKDTSGDDDEKPVRRGRKAAKDDDDYLSDYEDEGGGRRGKATQSVRRSRGDDEDDSDDRGRDSRRSRRDRDEDEDDEKPERRGRNRKSADDDDDDDDFVTRKGGKKSSSSDDDFEDIPNDEDEKPQRDRDRKQSRRRDRDDDEDEKPARRRSSRDDRDDDDDLDDTDEDDDQGGRSRRTRSDRNDDNRDRGRGGREREDRGSRERSREKRTSSRVSSIDSLDDDDE